MNTAIRAPAHLAPSPGPWRITDDGTVLAADHTVICVMGRPMGPISEQEIANIAALLATPALHQALKWIEARAADGASETFAEVVDGIKYAARLALMLVEGGFVMNDDPVPPARTHSLTVRILWPVECTICEWRGRRMRARSAPCPQCGSKVQYR